MTVRPILPETLPAIEAIPSLCAALRDKGAVVFQAPPGAGKTTVVPLALLGEKWLDQKKIVMLEPRRLAARLSARRMASLLGESVGETVGFRIRQETMVSAKTRIEVVTEGILTRMIQADPALSDVGLIIFDEYHERSLQADVGLALVLDLRSALREDLRIVVMSATLDGERVATLIGEAPLITSDGRVFPVKTRYLAPKASERLDSAMASAIRHALHEDSGSILAFLPGEGEIRRVQGLLENGTLPPDVDIAPLYGALLPAQQDAAVHPAPAGRRKVVLATSIAETSLTIDGIRVVIDGGLARRARFDPRSGLSRLVTTRVSLAEADQRRGRAGRLEPGVCYRLWPEAETRALAAFAPPEILEADLAPLALDLAAWGAAPCALRWLDSPPAANWSQAVALLQALGALDEKEHLTPHGKRMNMLPLHPRLAHMILTAIDRGAGSLACDVAALLSERDPLRGYRDADFRLRLDALKGDKTELGAFSVDRGVIARARQSATEWKRRLHVSKGQETAGSDDVGVILALAYPDRVAKRRGPGEYLLANGRGAALPDGDPLNAFDFLAVADLDMGPTGASQNARIFLAAPLVEADLESLFSDRIEEKDVVGWNDRSQSVQARRQRRLGALILRDAPLPSLDPSRLAEGLIDGIRRTGLHVLPWTKASEQFRDRVAFLRRVEKDHWPDMSDEGLLSSLDEWLAPYLSGLSKLSQIKDISLLDALKSRLSWDMQHRLEAEAPTHFEVPTGSRIALDYSSTETPVLAVRLQELFGLAEHPSLARGKVPLVLHLLSPAHRPIQITQDLPGFWRGSYAAVKAEMKGRYPKHPWPDDPLAASPTRRAKPRGT